MIFCCGFLHNQCLGQSVWPAESWNAATNLSSLYAGFANDLSGAHWNDENRELWLAINGPGTIVRLKENGTGGFQYNASWMPFGDLEGITQANSSDSTVFVVNEGAGQILEFDIRNPATVNLIHTWTIGPDIPVYNGFSGPEGLAFVPDEWLLYNNFLDQNGSGYLSLNGMGGLMFVAHQNGGSIYVFDLNRSNNSYAFIGEYKTNRTESAGLEFDRSTGLLHIWHNLGNNYLEVTDLTSVPSGSVREFIMMKEYLGPRTGNLEGIALTPASSTDNWCWITLDDGGADALRWFKQFETCLVFADFDVDTTRVCPDQPILFTNTSVGTCGTETYFWNFGAGASPDTASGAGPHLVDYATSGPKSITLVVTGENVDSSIQSNFIVVDSIYEHTQFTSVCYGDSLIFPDGSSEYNIVSPFSDTSVLKSIRNCDSNVITFVDVHPIFSSIDDVLICFGEDYTFPGGNMVFSIVNPISDTAHFQTIRNCDSTIITNLALLPVYDHSQTASLCFGGDFIFPDGDTLNNITHSMMDTSHLLSNSFCDSTVVTTLNINPVFQTIDSVLVCYGDQFILPSGNTLNNVTASFLDTSVLQTTLTSCDIVVR